MKILFSEALISIAKSAVLSVLIILIISGSVFLIGGTAGYFVNTQNTLDTFESVYSEDSTRMIISTMPQRDIYMSREGLEKYFQTLSQLKAKYPEYVQFRYNRFSVILQNFDGPDKLLYLYDEGTPIKNRNYPLNNLTDFSSVNSLTVSPEFLNTFHLDVVEGINFDGYSEQKLTYSEDGIYPVILGYDFAEYYNIGDTFSVVADSAIPIINTYEVVGFLRGGCAILDTYESLLQADEETEDTLIYLDNYMVLPALDYTPTMDLYPEKSKNGDFYHFMYQQYKNMLVVSSDNPDEVVWNVNDFFWANGYTKIEGWNIMNIPRSLKVEIDDYFDLLLYCSIFIAATAVICISANVSNKINHNLKKYAVHLLCGASLSTVRAFAAFEVLLLLFISNIIAGILLFMIGPSVFSFTLANIYSTTVGISWVSIAAILALDLIVFILSLAYPLWRINHAEYDTFLRGNE